MQLKVCPCPNLALEICPHKDSNVISHLEVEIWYQKDFERHTEDDSISIAQVPLVMYSAGLSLTFCKWKPTEYIIK